jgi:hypothetical protein
MALGQEVENPRNQDDHNATGGVSMEFYYNFGASFVEKSRTHTMHLRQQLPIWRSECHWRCLDRLPQPPHRATDGPPRNQQGPRSRTAPQIHHPEPNSRLSLAPGGTPRNQQYRRLRTAPRLHCPKPESNLSPASGGPSGPQHQ